MRVLLIDFSGTGNTSLCGKYIAESFIKHGHEAIHYTYKKDVPIQEDFDSYDLIGFGYPIHAFNVPEAFNKYIKALPKVNNKKYFIYKVSGEPFHLNDASSFHIVKKLKKKGFILYSEKHFLMPYNIMFRYRDSIAKQMYLYLKPLSEAFTLEMLNDEPELIKYKFRYKIVSFLLRIEWIAPKLNAPFIHIKTKKCVNCNKCVNDCPTNAIFINKKGKIRVKSSKCTMCMKCAMFCGCDAITYGFMNPWKVNKPYPYESIKNNMDIAPEYINHETKGYFKKFNKYFDKQKELLEKYNIENPIESYLSR